MKKDYISRLRRAARWMLSPEDAAEVIADYEEMAAGRADEELLRDMGDPVQAVRQLADEKTYRRWLLFFAAMALCAALPVLFRQLGVRPWYHDFYYALPLAGCLLSAWFWRKRGAKSPLPKGLLPDMFVLLLATALVQGFLWWVVCYPFWEKPFPTRLATIGRASECFCVLLVAVCVVGLVRARMVDRRWRALYALGLTAIALTLGLLQPLTALDIYYAGPYQLAPYLTGWYIAAAVGLGLTGWSLC
ncbi:MAG: hypothetical protein E7422_03620 [Ruminococcaceae bacterium]|nr:hypothetical protein [Oscillospiraceae bacterium]